MSAVRRSPSPLADRDAHRQILQRGREPHLGHQVATRARLAARLHVHRLHRPRRCPQRLAAAHVVDPGLHTPRQRQRQLDHGAFGQQRRLQREAPGQLHKLADRVLHTGRARHALAAGQLHRVGVEEHGQRAGVAKGDLRALVVAARVQAIDAEQAVAAHLALDDGSEGRADVHVQVHLVALALAQPLDLRAAVDRATVVAGEHIAQPGRWRPLECRGGGGRRRRGCRGRSGGVGEHIARRRGRGQRGLCCRRLCFLWRWRFGLRERLGHGHRGRRCGHGRRHHRQRSQRPQRRRRRCHRRRRLQLQRAHEGHRQPRRPVVAQARPGHHDPVRQPPMQGRDTDHAGRAASRPVPPAARRACATPSSKTSAGVPLTRCLRPRATLRSSAALSQLPITLGGVLRRRSSSRARTLGSPWRTRCRAT
jgi:hypothetical protein